MAGYLIIFFSRVVDVSLSTIRTLMVMQSRKVHAAIIGFFEITIYVTALGKVMSDLSNPFNLLAYGLGFACGTYVGITIENMIALGNLGVQIILTGDDNLDLIAKLRSEKFGVTVLEGEGKDGKKDVLTVIINRKDLTKLKEIVYKFDEDAFITTSSITPQSGGFFAVASKK